MLNTLKNENQYFFESSCEFYEDLGKDDKIRLEVEISGNSIIFSINWIDHDISVAGLTLGQAEDLVKKLNKMIDKIRYRETIEYFRKNKKMHLKHPK